MSEQVKKLQQALKQEENGAIREIILIILLLNDGKTPKEIAKFIGCSSIGNKLERSSFCQYLFVEKSVN